MKINRKSPSFVLFVISMTLLGAVYLYLSVRLNFLDQQLVKFRHETHQRKYVKSLRYWVEYETQSREHQ